MTSVVESAEIESKDYIYECQGCRRRFVTSVAAERHLLSNHSEDKTIGYVKKRLADL
jgi:hypothetical protein